MNESRQHRILVTGADGQLGREFHRILANRDDFAPWFGDAAELDITNRDAVRSVLQAFRPDTVVNCAAFTAVDACETNEKKAFQVNALGPKHLAIETEALGASIVQVSTDYVFDGTSGKPYREFDPVNPQSVYGRSKLAGETFVARFNPRHCIVRTAWLYGDGANFVATMLKLAHDRDEVSVVDDQYGSPTCTEDLAKVILDLVRGDHRGIYHATGGGICTWHAFAEKIFGFSGLPITVKPMSTKNLGRPAPRPAFSKLENFMLGLECLDSFRPWELALDAWLVGQGEPLVAAAKKARGAQ